MRLTRDPWCESSSPPSSTVHAQKCWQVLGARVEGSLREHSSCLNNGLAAIWRGEYLRSQKHEHFDRLQLGCNLPPFAGSKTSALW